MIPASIELTGKLLPVMLVVLLRRRKVEKRIIRFEDDMWRIRTDVGDLPKSERSELIEYFDEIRLSYRLVGGRLCIVGEIDRETVFEIMEHFYDGRADVLPF